MLRETAFVVLFLKVMYMTEKAFQCVANADDTVCTGSKKMVMTSGLGKVKKLVLVLVFVYSIVRHTVDFERASTNQH